MAKVGLSYSRCILDIVEGRVDKNDVLIIISRTDFDPSDDDQWLEIWEGYSKGSPFNKNAEWRSYTNAEDEKIFRNVTLDLWRSGKLHQPRQFGANPRRSPYYWLEAVLPTDELEKNPAAKNAWDQFQVIAGLSNVKLDKEVQ